MHRGGVAMPAAFRSVSRFPVVSIAVDAAIPADRLATGLPMHDHDESWLALVTGKKRWWVDALSHDLLSHCLGIA